MDEDVLAPGIRPVLHDQGGRQGDGARPVDGLWNGAPVGRQRTRSRASPGRGTTVKLYFRRADRDGEVPASGGKTGDQLRRSRGAATVLVIDDDPDVRQFIAAGLEEYGHEVIEAADGGEGIEKFAATSPDLVIVDYIMPGLSGAEVAGHILATRPDQPILFVSGYNETDAIRRVAPECADFGQALPGRDPGGFGPRCAWPRRTEQENGQLRPGPRSRNQARHRSGATLRNWLSDFLLLGRSRPPAADHRLFRYAKGEAAPQWLGAARPRRSTGASPRRSSVRGRTDTDRTGRVGGRGRRAEARNEGHRENAIGRLS